MPQIKIKRGGQTSSSNPTLDDGELYLANDGAGEGKLYAGTSDGDTNTDKVRVKYSYNSDYAGKVGTESSHPQIGSPTKPVYVTDGGVITESNANVGVSSEHGSQPVYMYNGEIKPLDASIGNSNTPVYIDSGVFYGADKYAGGTKVTLNGTPLGGQDVTIYAPSSAPSSSGTGKRVALCDKPGTPFWSSGSFGSSTEPLYLGSNGILTKASKYSGGTKVTLNGTDYGAQDKSFYAPESLGQESNILATRSGSLQWTDCPFTNAVYSSDSGYVYDTTVTGVTKGIYAILAYESSLGEYYTFYVIVHSMAVDNKYVSTSYTTQPSSGFTPSCCVVATVSSSTSINFKVEENSGNRDWYFRRIYKVTNIA